MPPPAPPLVIASEPAAEPPPAPVTADALAVKALIAQIEAAMLEGSDESWEKILNELFPALMSKDRAAAARLVVGLPAGDRRELLLRRLSRAWAAVDFADAVSWIATLTDTAERKAAFEDACFQAAETDPAEAIEAWGALEFTADDHVMENLVQSWAEKDLKAAQAWVGSKPSSMQRDQAVARVAYVMARIKPSESVAFITRELPPGPAQEEAVVSVIHQWGQQDLPGATAWVQQLPAGTLADRARNELAGISR